MLDRARARLSQIVAAPFRSLLGKYIAYFIAALGVPLVGYTLMGVWLASVEQRTALVEVQRAKTASAAIRISTFVHDIEGQLRFLTQLGWGYAQEGQYRLDALRVLRQAPAVNRLTFLDEAGQERLVVARAGVDRMGAGRDRSSELAVRTARQAGVHYGPVYLERGSQPFMTLAIAGARPDAGIVLADINITHAQDVIEALRIGKNGQAYVIDSAGRVIAHPDIAVVLRNTDASRILDTLRSPAGTGLHFVSGLLGQRAVLSHEQIPGPNWSIVLEIPESEANEPLKRMFWRSSAVGILSFCIALLIAMILAFRMVKPVRTLSEGAVKIGSGELDYRIRIEGQDELAALGTQFNQMATDLERARNNLEAQVDDRTRKLRDANLAKSRFLAAASHDLRQPLHALNLLVAQLSKLHGAEDAQRLAVRIEQAMASINGLFDNLLDISRLEAGVVKADVMDVRLQSIFDRVEATFASAAKEKGLGLTCRPTEEWTRTDPILLQRIVFNLVGNAIRYTEAGRVILAARRRDGMVRIEVWDSGMGIPGPELTRIFDDFYQIDRKAGNGLPGAGRREGLGLGLAIVARLAALLDHPLDVRSRPGKGSWFSILVPRSQTRRDSLPVAGNPEQQLSGLRVLVIDNHEEILAGMGGLLQQWGCHTLPARSREEAFLVVKDGMPDMILADLHLDGDDDGVATIRALRNHFGCSIPAVIISGDVTNEARSYVQSAGLLALEKPISPLRLRTIMVRLSGSALSPSQAPSQSG